MINGRLILKLIVTHVPITIREKDIDNKIRH